MSEFMMPKDLSKFFWNFAMKVYLDYDFFAQNLPNTINGVPRRDILLVMQIIQYPYVYEYIFCENFGVFFRDTSSENSKEKFKKLHNLCKTLFSKMTMYVFKVFVLEWMQNDNKLETFDRFADLFLNNSITPCDSLDFLELLKHYGIVKDSVTNLHCVKSQIRWFLALHLDKYQHFISIILNLIFKMDLLLNNQDIDPILFLDYSDHIKYSCWSPSVNIEPAEGVSCDDWNVKMEEGDWIINAH